MLRFRVLGPLEVERDGVSVEVAGQRQRAVLALMLVNANRVVASERMVAELWGEEPPRTAVTSLHNAVSALRKALGAEVVETRPSGYVLHVEPNAVDLELFERLLSDARELPAEGRLPLLEEALALWTGPPLAELSYESFAQGEIRRLEELRLSAVEDRLGACLELGRHAELVGELEALAARHPHRERLRGHLMLALYRSGRQRDALEAYGDARRTLAEDLGLDPGPALRALHGAILRQDPELDLASAVATRRAASGPALDEHVREVGEAVLAGRVVPVLGAEAAGVAEVLAERFRYPQGEPVEVPRVAEWAAVTRGYGPLYDELHALSGANGPPGGVHQFLASLPPLLRARGAPHQLVVTTGYGTALERAFADAGEEFDLVSYIATGRNRGRFRHLPPGGEPRVVEEPNRYATELSLERRTVILKLCGHADPSPAREWESYVVTEDDYIDYLGRGDVASGVPVSLVAALRRSHFLFLGFTVRDWNLRVVLGRMWGDHPLSYRSWAVNPEPGPAERELWRRLDVDLVAADLDDYVKTLAGVALPFEARA